VRGDRGRRGRRPDTWRGTTTVVDEVCRRQTLDRGFNAALLGSVTLGRVFRAERSANDLALRRPPARAHREGTV
jgi:hypothetical protein